VRSFLSALNIFLIDSVSVRSSCNSIPSRALIPDWTEHLSRALPTEKIFYLLRSNKSELYIYIHDNSAELMLDTLESIIKWLQVSFSECNGGTPQLKIRFVSRNLGPSDRATCTIASRMNFFDTKLSLNLSTLTWKFEI
jgi:hypothetical protein